jgi:hypothetical protein
MKWNFGIGTGFTSLKAEGSLGLNAGQFGPIVHDVDMDPDEFRDLLSTAFGFATYVSDGDWIISASFKKFKLKGEPEGPLPASVGGGTYTAEIDYKVTRGEFTVGYTIYRSRNAKFSLTPYIGTRYIKHDIEADVGVIQGQSNSPLWVSRQVDYNWTDFLIGGAIAYNLSSKWIWSASSDGGFGGSDDGSFSLLTGIGWRAMKHFTFSINYRYSTVSYENDFQGDPEWFLYDADESGAGIGIMYHL